MTRIFKAVISVLLLVASANAGPLVTQSDDNDMNMRQKRQAGECGCDATVYDKPNYGGESLLIRQQNSWFHNDFYDNRVESIQIDGSCDYIFYKHSNFQGRSYLLSPKSYASPQTWGENGNSISSARALPPAGTEAILLFEHDNYQGRMVTLYGSRSALSFLSFNDHISSAIVTGGYWTVYDHPYYRGVSHYLGPGHYPNPVRGAHDWISSVKKG